MSTKNTSIARLAGLSKAFLSVRTTGDLSELLAFSPAHIAAAAARPRYYVFDVPKKGGALRRIEDPDDNLQPVQTALNEYLQAVYWRRRSDAAYGFLAVPAGDPSPRHIETNAAQHLGKAWLLNADLKDFFHQVTKERVRAVFAGEPFGFGAEVCDLLTRLCTYRGRCPMGAPTSPVLSNLAFRDADEDLLVLSRRRGWTYTRYADDMSFSCHEPLSWDAYTDIQRCVKRHGFVFNPEKATLYGPDDAKIVTGLLLGPRGVEIPPDFIPQIADDIRQLSGAVRVQYRVDTRGSRTLERFKRSVEGKLRFVDRIMGPKHPAAVELWKDYRAALAPPKAYGSRGWLDFDYF